MFNSPFPTDIFSTPPIPIKLKAVEVDWSLWNYRYNKEVREAKRLKRVKARNKRRRR